MTILIVGYQYDHANEIANDILKEMISQIKLIDSDIYVDKEHWSFEITVDNDLTKQQQNKIIGIVGSFEKQFTKCDEYICIYVHIRF